MTELEKVAPDESWSPGPVWRAPEGPGMVAGDEKSPLGEAGLV